MELLSNVDFFLIFIGLGVGLAVGLTGVGGGAIMTPLLILFTDLNIAAVIAVDLFFASITKISATIIHYKNKNIDFFVLKRLWAGSIPGAILIVLIANQFNLFDSELLLPFIGTILIISGILMGISHESQSIAKRLRNNFPENFKRKQYKLTVFLGFLLGSLVGLTSIGAGAIGALVLRALYPLRMIPKVLVGTDTIHAIPVAFIAGLGYFFFGNLEIFTLVCLLIGSIPGSIIGSSYANKINPHWLKVFIAIAILTSGIKLVL
jgi:uncharacterized membrane protein YfcA